MTKAQTNKIKELTPLIQAIRNRCLDCSANNSYEVSMCVCPDCALFPYRCGLNSPEQDFTRGKLEKTPKNASGEGVLR